MSNAQDRTASEPREQDDDQFMDEDQMDEGGLFGSGSEDEAAGARDRRQLDDAELDSGDDEGRDDRMEGDDYGKEQFEAPKRDLKIQETSVGRHAVPRGSDGELYHLKFPKNVGIDPKAFTLQGFSPPTTDHHSSDPPPSNFSAFNTTINTIRYRQDPKDPSRIQSNARILRWSDGSLTLQLASNPLIQYELKPKSLTSPQVNPNTPTPTGLTMPNHPPNTRLFDPVLESNTYLAAPHEHAGLIRHTNHITTALTLQSEEQDDEALQRLQESLAAATRGNKASADGGLEVISITEDPELAKKRAELAEKEKNAAQRKLQAQQDKETSRANNVLRRSGLRTGMGGLTVGGLEDEDGMGATKGRVPKPKSRNARRRNSEYSEDEEDFRGKGHTREDEYDEDDGFLVGSDEEPEVGEEESEEDAEMDAEGEEDEEVVEKEKPKTTATTGGRVKSKRVIDDEDEE